MLPEFKLSNLMYESVYRNEAISFNNMPVRFPKNRSEALVKLCPTGNRVLEIGFGAGEVLFNIRNKFKEIYGIEFSTVRCSKVQAAMKSYGTNIKCCQGNIESALDFPDGHFDVILWADVIEHVVDVWKAMAEISRLLAPVGKLITSTPNIAYFRRRIKLLKGKFPSTSGTEQGLVVRPGELFDGGHLHYFTFSSLEAVYKKFGINPELRLGFGRLGKLHNIYPSLLSGSACILGTKV